MTQPRLTRSLIAAAALAIMTGCFLFDAPADCPSGDGLRITAPASGATIPGGDDTTIAYSYRSSYAYDTLQIFAGAAVVCTTELTGGQVSASGTCPWNTTGLATGPIELTLRAIDLRTTPVCFGVVSSPRAVTITATAPTIDTHPTDTTANEGTTASFTATARGSGPLTLQWQRSDGGGDYVDTPGATATTLNLSSTTAADDGALFRLVAANPEGSATSDPARLTVVAGCPVPLFPDLDRSEPTVVGPPAATLNANLLANPSFEGTVWVGLQPTGFGYWRFDESASVTARQGIVPRSGDAMMQFVSASRDVALFGSANASEQVQVVDVTALQAAIDAETVRLRASAWFARVAGCATTDDRFGLFAIAFDGGIGTYQEKWANGIAAATAQGVERDVADMTGVDGWLLHRQVAMRHDDPGDRIETASRDVFDWRELAIEADLPAGTTLLVVVLYAAENVLNDTAFPEFHGHYADDAEVVLTPRAP